MGQRGRRMTGHPRQGFLAAPRAGRMDSVQPPTSPGPNADEHPTTKALRRSPGRPSLFTAKVWEQILNGLAEGMPLSRICAAPGMPCPETIRCWRRDDPRFAREFDFAQQCGWDYPILFIAWQGFANGHGVTVWSRSEVGCRCHSQALDRFCHARHR